MPSMAPLSRGIDTLKSVVAWPPVTPTVRTHVLPPSAVATELDVVTPAVVEAKLKSSAVTPVTAWSNVAVNVMTESTTALPLAPALAENVGVGGVYLRGKDKQLRQVGTAPTMPWRANTWQLT